MKKYAIIILVMLVLFTALFGLAEWLQVPLLTRPAERMQSHPVLGALIGTGLLMLDVFFPVPSSVIMGINGQMFGVVGGTLLSLLGTMSAAILGFVIGRRGGPLLDRIAKPEERAQANRLLEKYGALAIIVTRPVPMLAETMTILAGTSGMSWTRMLLSAFAGSLPTCYLFSMAGDNASLAVMFCIILAIAAVFWIAGRLLLRDVAPVPETAKKSAEA